MGMLMHHTWLNQQKQKEQPKKVEKPVAEQPKEESPQEPVKRPGRRKSTDK